MNIPLFQLENHGVKHSVAYKTAYHKTYYHIVCFTGKVAFVLSSLQFLRLFQDINNEM